MSEKAFKGVSVSTKGGHSKLRGQTLQRHASVWWMCVQMAHGEDLDRLNGGSESSVHFVWGRRTQQDKLEQGPANNAIPMRQFNDTVWLQIPLASPSSFRPTQTWDWHCQSVNSGAVRPCDERVKSFIYLYHLATKPRLIELSRIR